MSSKCGICSNTVYPVDPQINLNGSIYHKVCAKCVDCRCQITLANFTKSGDTLLCKTHYIKRFNEQGTHLGSDKFNKQPVRGMAAYNPATDPSAQAAAAPSSASKDFADDPERANSVKERMKKFASLSNTPKCAICDRSVYANDPQVVLDGLSYHRACAKCTECKCQITIQNFTKSGSTLYCKTHYIKKFKEEGTILGAEKFAHKSAPGMFAGSGFTIARSESMPADSEKESDSKASESETTPTKEPIALQSTAESELHSSSNAVTEEPVVSQAIPESQPEPEITPNDPAPEVVESTPLEPSPIEPAPVTEISESDVTLEETPSATNPTEPSSTEAVEPIDAVNVSEEPANGAEEPISEVAAVEETDENPSSPLEENTSV